MDREYSEWKAGDRVEFRGLRQGTLLTDSKYRSTPSMGWFEAKIQWDDGEKVVWVLNQAGLVRIEAKTHAPNPFDYTEAELYELMLKQGEKRFGSECKHEKVRHGRCLKCLRKVVTTRNPYK